MLEKQRIHLEGLIDNLVSSAIEAEQKIGTDKVEMAMEARRMAGDRVKEYLDFIQSYVGTMWHHMKHQDVAYNDVHRGPDSLPRQTIREED